jgi:hypothetical protein
VKNPRDLRLMVATIRLPSRTAATARLRALKRLEPLPCAKITSARALLGTCKAPASPTGGMTTSRMIARGE